MTRRMAKTNASRASARASRTTKVSTPASRAKTAVRPRTPATKTAATKTAAMKTAATKTAATKTAATKTAATKTAATKTAKTSTAPPSDDVLRAFWSMIERIGKTSRGDLEGSIAAFRAELEILDDTALLASEAAFCTAMRLAYDYNLWAAAYVIHGGCGDDTFWDFRAGLVALGRETYDAALRDPETLAGIDDVENLTLFEGFQYVPGTLLEKRGLTSIGGGHGMAGKPTGEAWNHESELETRFPKLSARFG